MILHVLDGAEPLSSDDKILLSEFADKKRLIVRNKSDLPRRLELLGGLNAIDLSCATGEGIEALKDAIKEKVWAGQIGAEMLEAMINSRHEDALRRGRAGIDLAASALDSDLGLELVALDLRIAVDAIGEIVGKTTTEDLLDAIFSQFCIGK
jgi:tRNA modification GTPase